MVRAILLSASTAAAIEPTGLLQATVGVQSHLAVGADKASSMKKMQKEWEAAAKAGASIDDDSLQAVYDSMQDIIGQTSQIKADIEEELASATVNVNNVFGVTYIAHDNMLITQTGGGEWAGVCQSLENHATCRGQETAECESRDVECQQMTDVQGRCISDNPLCNCDDLNNSAEQMVACLVAAKKWHDDFHTTLEGTPGFALGMPGSKTTRADLDKEERECTEGNGSCSNQKSSCDTLQASAQQNFCMFNQRCADQCSNYNNAFQTALTEFQGTVALQVGDDSFESRNKEVCFSALKVVCFINVIANKGYAASKSSTWQGSRGRTYDLDDSHSADFRGDDGTVDGAGYTYDFCLNYTPDCSPLNIEEDHYDDPQPADCSSFACSGKIQAGGLPEEDGWLAGYYQSNTLECSHNIGFYLESQPEAMHSCLSEDEDDE